MSLKETLSNNPEYFEILKKIVEYEENNPKPDNHHIEDTDYDTCWDFKDIGVHPNKLYQLETQGLMERVFDTASSTIYALRDREEVKELVNDIEITEDIKEVMHDFPDEDELPDNLFREIIGYDDLKWLLKRSLTTDKISNFLFLGPPGCGKTLFLRSIHKHLNDAKFVFGGEATSAGYYEVIFNETPKYMLFDEIGDMGDDNQTSLAGYTDEGILSETKHSKTRTLKTNSNTYATANYRENIVDKIYDRFEVLELEAYDYDEFMNVCEHLLPIEENKTEKESKKIAKAVWDMKDRGDVRQALRIARLSDGDPEKVVNVLKNYSSSNNNIINVI